MTFEFGPAVLFCPADRPERFAKAADRADAVILDLEDAVPAAQKEAARAAVVAAELDPERVAVRVNTAVRAEFESDLEALRRSPFRFVVVGKCEDRELLDRLDGFQAIAQIETPLGYQARRELAGHPFVTALFWGPDDFAQAIGAWASRRPGAGLIEPLRTVRSELLVAAAAAGKTTLDAPYSDYTDVEGLFAEAEDAAAGGFVGKACIHPAQVEAIRRAFTPAAETVARAREVLAAAGSSDGVFSVGGAMVDAPLVAQARRIVSRASSAATAAGA